jgi:type I restriction enzyme M protein
MVSKMKPLDQSPVGSRIASVHNGSSLFTGDAGGGESNIRRYLIENDWLEAIIQLPNNLFYNTGITTYIWLLSNNKPAQRRGKVQLIDASLLYRKLRKNLGNKNCEFSPEDIREIVRVYQQMETVEKQVNPTTGEDQGIAAKIFDNRDFGYYKVTVERPKRLMAQFTEERIVTLRFDKGLREPMEWAYAQYGEAVYTELAQHEKELLNWCEQQDLNLSAKQAKALCSPDTWNRGLLLLQTATRLMQRVGTDTWSDFNKFSHAVNEGLMSLGSKLTASDRNAILNAVSWYDASAEKVLKGTVKLNGPKLEALLERLGCTEAQLPDFGYYPTGRKGEWLQYESESDLRDTESVPLKEEIYSYFMREVRPHVEEAWLNLETTKIGYEISFNKYFYRHKRLRDLELVSQEILKLERKSEGLILDILSLA